MFFRQFVWFSMYLVQQALFKKEFSLCFVILKTLKDLFDFEGWKLARLLHLCAFLFLKPRVTQLHNRTGQQSFEKKLVRHSASCSCTRL